jgi:hypothetical protein
MTWDDALRVIGSSLFSVLSAGAIIMGLASWLGKIWAERILRKGSMPFSVETAWSHSFTPT